eukprot:g2405.t1
MVRVFAGAVILALVAHGQAAATTCEVRVCGQPELVVTTTSTDRWVFEVEVDGRRAAPASRCGDDYIQEQKAECCGGAVLLDLDDQRTLERFAWPACEIEGCMARCVARHGSISRSRQSPAWYCAKGCAGLGQGGDGSEIEDRAQQCVFAPASRRAQCRDERCPFASKHKSAQALCRDGCEFWGAGVAAAWAANASSWRSNATATTTTGAPRIVLNAQLTLQCMAAKCMVQAATCNADTLGDPSAIPPVRPCYESARCALTLCGDLRCVDHCMDDRQSSFATSPLARLTMKCFYEHCAPVTPSPTPVPGASVAATTLAPGVSTLAPAAGAAGTGGAESISSGSSNGSDVIVASAAGGGGAVLLLALVALAVRKHVWERSAHAPAPPAQAGPGASAGAPTSAPTSSASKVLPLGGSRPKLFLSYGRGEASDFARWLKTRLEQSGFDVWFDENDISASSNWQREIGEALRGCDGLVAVLNAKYIHSDFCKNELAMANSHSKLLFPLLFRSFEFGQLPAELEYPLASTQCCSFADEARDGASFDTFVSGLRARFAADQRVRAIHSRREISRARSHGTGTDSGTVAVVADNAGATSVV